MKCSFGYFAGTIGLSKSSASKNFSSSESLSLSVGLDVTDGALGFDGVGSLIFDTFGGPVGVTGRITEIPFLGELTGVTGVMGAVFLGVKVFGSLMERPLIPPYI